MPMLLPPLWLQFTILPFSTGDPEFKKLEKKEAISIEWLA